jgi:hypothetical protein
LQRDKFENARFADGLAFFLDDRSEGSIIHFASNQTFCQDAGYPAPSNTNFLK